jgi:hypothetical protein
MAEDLAKLSAQNEALNQEVEKIPSLQKNLEVHSFLDKSFPRTNCADAEGLSFIQRLLAL